MKKPIIGISANILKDQSGSFAGYQRAYVNEDYVISVLKNGGVPFIIPINQNS
ncbi:MAG: gamma-glutamyl-gamma-aminobutyrate hydrolase family protein, partial [Lactobacillaceae bacterium]